MKIHVKQIKGLLYVTFRAVQERPIRKRLSTARAPSGGTGCPGRSGSLRPGRWSDAVLGDLAGAGAGPGDLQGSLPASASLGLSAARRYMYFSVLSCFFVADAVACCFPPLAEDNCILLSSSFCGKSLFPF